MIAVLDYGVGNLFSLCSSLRAIGAEVVVTADPVIIKKADRLILPGVGAFEDAAKKLRESGLDQLIKEEVAAGKPIMGICLGMQLLFERSHEYGIHEGLGLLKGEILPFSQSLDATYKIPHIGWNALRVEKDVSLFRYVKDGDCVYFVHSFYASEGLSSTAATTEYGIRFTAAVAEGNVFGCQFHPEKSGSVGLAILRGFCEAGGARC
ncbi:MAG: imidazole glycerol phosphate synthase subunit HisH [Clostridia bacterium]|nr:imidazole glycerol phosphate synthase subunit HisH [Clostridia bacterium]